MDTDIISVTSDEEDLEYGCESLLSSLLMRRRYTPEGILKIKARQQDILLHLRERRMERVRHFIENRHVQNVYLKKGKGKEDTKRQSSSFKGSSTSDEEQPCKKRRHIKRKIKTRTEKEDAESESSSSKESSTSDGEVLSNKPQIMHIQSKSRITKAGNEKQQTKFPTGGKSSPKNQFQKSFDDTLTQSIVEELSIKMKSVGVLVSCGDPAGTVFSVGDKYVMTAYHVINGIPGLLKRAKMWGFATSVGIFVCWVTGNLWYAVYTTPGNPWYNPTTMASNPILWSYIISFIQAFSHLTVPQVPPYISGLTHWEDMHTFFFKKYQTSKNNRRKMLFMATVLLTSPIFPVAVVWISWPHLIGTMVLCIMSRIGYKHSIITKYRRIVEKAGLSGNPFLDHFPTCIEDLTQPDTPFIA